MTEHRRSIHESSRIDTNGMELQLHPTPYADVNAVLEDLFARIRTILGEHFVGMYVLGSLALGDFDPHHSDIDFVVVTDTELGDDLFQKLKNMHAQAAANGSPWSTRVEMVYISRDALRNGAAPGARYPQLEKGGELFWEALESGWVFQRYTLRERGLTVAGPDPRTLLGPVNMADMPPAVATITGQWLEQAHHDPAWLMWLRDRHNQAFVVFTLCRMLYSLATGMVTSKPAAARWAQAELGASWDKLIGHSLAKQHEPGDLPQNDVDDTVDFIQYTVERSQTDTQV